MYSIDEQEQEPISPSTSNNQQYEHIHLSFTDEQQPSSSSNYQQPEQIHSLSADEQQQPTSSSSNRQKRGKILLSSSEPSRPISSSSSTPVSDIADISHSIDELPARPILDSYPLNKDKRCFRSQWFSQYEWLEYSKQTYLAYCHYCRHFSTGVILNN